MKRFFALFLVLLCVMFRAFADNVTLTASIPATIEEGSKFKVMFTANSQNISNFSAPDFKGFEVLYGPTTSSQSSFQFVNGRTTQSSSVIYTYILYASKAGSFTIGSASINADGKVVKSKPCSIKVLPAGQGGGHSGSSVSSAQPSRQSSSASGTNVSSEQLFMTATASKMRVHEQEAILLTYKLYTLVNVVALDGKLPTLDGFQVQEMPLSNNKQVELEQYNGRNYQTVVWCQYVLYPQKSGDLVIPSITYEGVVRMRNPHIDPFEAFFNGNGGIMEVKKKITTPKLTIHVSPLPTKPANFSGAVGKFTMSSSLSPQELMANDAITLRLKVNGTGNMKLIKAPDVDFPKDFETYDVKVNDNFSLTKSGLSGTKEFEYLAVPRHAGKYKIPSVDFVFFDPQTKTYKTLSSEEFTINVKKGNGGGGHSVSDYSTHQQDVKELGQDIRYIKTGEVAVSAQDETFFGSVNYWLCYIVPFVLFVAGLLIGRQRIKANANVAKSRGKKANKMASKRLKKAAKLLNTQNQGEFYDEVMRALWGYIADKLNMPQESLNKDNVQSELASRGVNEEAVNAFIKALNDCEFARYAPGDAASNMQGVYNGAVDAIGKIEDNI